MAGAVTTTAIVLSDRATLRLERGGALDAEIAPAALYQQLAATMAGAARRGAAARRAQALPDAAGRRRVRRRCCGDPAELDALTLVLAGDGVATPTTDLVVVYLPGLDIAQHALLGGDATARRRRRPLSARLAALEATTTSRSTRCCATLLRAGPDELVMVVTAPGRVAGRRERPRC